MEETGKCACKIGYQAPHCASCSTGYSGYPDCEPCSAHGTNFNESSPNKCSCKQNFDGRLCDSCKSLNFEYPQCGGKDYKFNSDQENVLKLNILISVYILGIESSIASTNAHVNHDERNSHRSINFQKNPFYRIRYTSRGQHQDQHFLRKPFHYIPLSSE